MRQTENLYMLITDDEYELPIYVADSQAELARLCGVDPGGICKELKLQTKHIWSKYIKIPIQGEYNLPTREELRPNHNNKQCRPVIGNGIRYESMTEAADKNNVSVRSIGRWIRSKEEWSFACEN